MKKVKKEESAKDKYISNCMTTCKEPDHEKRLAICFSKWRKSQKSLLLKKTNKVIKALKNHITKLEIDTKIKKSEKTGILYNIEKSLKEIINIKRNNGKTT